MGPDTGAHIQHSEQMWGSAIRKKKKQNHHRKHNLESHLCEFMCRHSGKGKDPSGKSFTNYKVMFSTIWIFYKAWKLR